jgi:7-carboxy-7-deazaguanine synthase
MDKILISEIFGPTIQGEGSLVGQPTVFIRVAGCDYKCKWCDTLYAVLREHRKEWIAMSSKDIYSKIRELSFKPILVTLSGGNPALYDFSELISMGHKNCYSFNIESQGSVPAEWFKDLDYVTFSPKPPSSEMITDFTKLDKSVELAGDINKITMKIVVSCKEDYDFAKLIFGRYPLAKKYITPCNINPGNVDPEVLFEMTREVINMVISDGLYDVTVIPQLHVLLWRNKRGV